jgi:hypothetical protein
MEEEFKTADKLDEDKILLDREDNMVDFFGKLNDKITDEEREALAKLEQESQPILIMPMGSDENRLNL